MLFNSDVFLFLFLPVVLAGYHGLRALSAERAPFFWLVLASLVFYGWWNPIYLPLLCFSIVANYGIAIAIDGASQHRRTIAIAGFVLNLGLLGYFKYTHFVLGNISALTGWDWSIGAIILPLGISFFTFQQIAFLADTYAGKARLPSLLDYALFVSFFPQLIAGPIVHHGEMMPQFRQAISSRRMGWSFAIGMTIFAFGLFKKVIIADNAALSSTPVFAIAAAGMPLGFAEAWQGALAYTAQIYFDFSAYSEMAIGLGLMFGVRLPVNFNSPYEATGIVDFWRRWHMTLSRFLRDYVYIPLGGNRKGNGRRYANLMTVMLVGGLWHGAGWTFVVWGGLHGLYLLINHAWDSSPLAVRHASTIRRRLAWLVTFLAVVLAWVFFRAESFSAVLIMLQAMAGFGADARNAFDGEGFAWVLLYLGIAFAMPNTLAMLRYYGPAIKRVAFSSPLPRHWLTWRPNARWTAATVLALVACVLMLWNASEFLYFQF